MILTWALLLSRFSLKGVCGGTGVGVGDGVGVERSEEQRGVCVFLV